VEAEEDLDSTVHFAHPQRRRTSIGMVTRPFVEMLAEVMLTHDKAACRNQTPTPLFWHLKSRYRKL
jgi:hypothetical protein